MNKRLMRWVPFITVILALISLWRCYQFYLAENDLGIAISGIVSLFMAFLAYWSFLVAFSPYRTEFYFTLVFLLQYSDETLNYFVVNTISDRPLYRQLVTEMEKTIKENWSAKSEPGKSLESVSLISYIPYSD